jgi:hypothetical protein
MHIEAQVSEGQVRETMNKPGGYSRENLHRCGGQHGVDPAKPE